MFQWSDEIYSVGIKKMDEQHKKLFGLLNVLAANRASIDYEQIDKVFNTLILYTQNHFSEEVRFLQKIKYPGVSSHLSQHDNFVEQLKKIKIKYDQERTPEIMDRLTNLVTEWLKHHILVEDKAYAKYLDL